MPKDTDAATLVRDTLGPIERLAVSYAPASVRPLWIGFLGLEARLEKAAHVRSEPVLAQIRMAWWRERFQEPASCWPQGEPLLALLASWDGERATLAELVDGWEASAFGDDGGVRLRAARVEAVLALCRIAKAGDQPDAVRRSVLEWTDSESHGQPHRLSRKMRPLAILRALSLKKETLGASGALLLALRVGCLGR